MTREEAKNRLIEVFGIDEPTKAQVSAYLNDRKNVESEIREDIEKEVKESYKDFISKEDADKLRSEISELKDASNKTSRIAKYKELGIVDDEDIIAMVDAKFKDSKDLEADVKEYAKNHKTFFTAKAEEKKAEQKEGNPVSTGKAEQQKEEPKQEIKAIGGVSANPVPESTGEMSWHDAVASHYSENK